ncbi:MAG: class I SAM-dependent methyltransferase [Myxococcota bacterium]
MLDSNAVAAIRRRDLLLTVTLLLIALTPAWFLPRGASLAWQVAVMVLAGPMLLLSWTHGPWQPTPPADLDRIISHLALSEQDRFVDLGSGDGRVLLSVAQATNADCTGIEAAPLMAFVGWLRTRFSGYAIHIRWGDLYRSELSTFDAAYVWGTAYSVGTEGFAHGLRERLRPGTRVVSYQHALAGWTPTTIDEEGERPIFVYDVGEAPQA